VLAAVPARDYLVCGVTGGVDAAAGERACRLTPDRALGTLAEAEAFLRDRGLLTRTADCALPSLYEACHEDPYKPGSPGFATWPATRWPWFGELAERGYLIVGVHRGKNLLVSEEVAGLLDPIAAPRSPVCGPPSRAGELARWDQAYPHAAQGDADPRRALADLVIAGVRAAVAAPERELRRWFSWQWYWADTLVDGLVRDGRLRRVGSHITVTA
jgi:hypothetical protein